MPIYPGMNKRISWYLPLVGGAEMNRLKASKPRQFTSQLYPVYWQEGLDTSIPVVRGVPFIGLEESLVNSVTLSGVSFTETIYSTHTLPMESISVGATLLGVTSTGTTYSTLNTGIESLSASTNLLGVDARITNYITYSNYTPEGMNTTVTLLGVTSK